MKRIVWSFLALPAFLLTLACGAETTPETEESSTEPEATESGLMASIRAARREKVKADLHALIHALLLGGDGRVAARVTEAGPRVDHHEREVVLTPRRAAPRHPVEPLRDPGGRCVPWSPGAGPDA